MNPSNKYYSQDQSIRFVMTTPEEETALFNWAKSPEKITPIQTAAITANPAFENISSAEDAREFLIRNHLLFAMTFAKKIGKSQLPFNEVVSAANFAVVKAFESFDPRFGSRFTTYLRPFIFGEIQTLWRSKFNAFNVPDPSLCGNNNQSSAKSITFRDGDSSGAADGAGVQRTARNEAEWTEARYGSEEHQGEELNLRDFNRERLFEVLQKLNSTDRELVQLHYFEGLSFADIARQRGITRMGVSLAHRRLLKRLEKALKTRVEEVI